VKILELDTGLFPDAQTVAAALRHLGSTHDVVTIDLRRPDLQDPDWDRVVAAILASDLTISL